jgi:glucokinase
MTDHNATKPLLAGVDVGGTKVAVLVTDSHYHVCGKVTVPTPLQGQDNTISGIVAAVQKAVSMSTPSVGELAAIGVGVPGRVDPDTGLVRSAVNLGWREVPLGETLAARLGVPCVVENDVRLAAVGMQRYLGEAAPQNMAYMSVGTGIAAGLVLNGRIYRGAHGLAGEIGHMVIAPGEGPVCQCGARGCLEALAAGPAIAAMGEKAARSDPQSLLREYRPITAEAVYKAAAEGDRAAQEIARMVGGYLALALQQLIVAYDVDHITLGGGVSRNGDAFFHPILDELARLRQHSVLTAEMIRPEMIRLLPPTYDAGTWGAVILAGSSMRR